MSATVIRRSLRNANMGGDPVESARLRPLFLAWCGRRSQKVALAAAGIDHDHGSAWLAGKYILRDIYQERVRRVLQDAGGVAMTDTINLDRLGALLAEYISTKKRTETAYNAWRSAGIGPTDEYLLESANLVTARNMLNDATEVTLPALIEIARVARLALDHMDGNDIGEWQRESYQALTKAFVDAKIGGAP